MTKGFMIFLEGGEPPKKVHKDAGYAFKEIYRLSKLYPDKTVTLYHICKRVKNEQSIGSHFADGSGSPVNVNELVTHDKVTGWKPNRTKKKAKQGLPIKEWGKDD